MIRVFARNEMTRQSSKTLDRHGAIPPRLAMTETIINFLF